MNLTRPRLASTIATVLAASIYGCGGDSITLPSQAEPAHIVLVTGDAQAGIAGSVLPLPLIVKVTNSLDKPVPGQGVEFTVTSGGGGVSPASVETGSDGRASVTWTLGASAGAQAVQAKVVGAGVPDNLTLDFSATAIAGSGSLIAAVSGDDQSAPVNSSLSDSLVVRVSDGNGNPVSGISITWTVQGGGSISPETVVTDDGGRAAAERVLGPTAGQQTAQAAGDGLAGSPVTFVQTAVASNPTALTLVSGDAQGAPAGFELAGDLVVQLTDADGNGVGGLAVAWLVTTGGGTPNPQNSTTDPGGFARTRWTLGTVAGPNTMTAVYSGLPPVSFTATGSNDAPTTIALVSGDNQTAVGGAALPQPLVVKVTDANNNPVPDVSVAWTAVGAGTVSGGVTTANSPTNGQGLAQITRTLGTTLGAYTTTAEVTGLAGSPVTFTSTASVGPAAKIVIVTQPSATAANGVQFATQPIVQVQDAGGNNVGPSGRAINASLLSPPTGGALHGDLGKDTDANGSAVFTDLNITGPVATYTIRFRSGALAEARADVAITAGAVSGSGSTVETDSPNIPAGGSATIKVTAKDAGGNPVPGVTVAIQANGGGNTLTQPGAPTDVNGEATATFSSTVTGAHTITATLNGSVTVSDNAVVTVDAGPPASIAVNAGDNQTGAAGGALAIDPSVIVKDASNNPVPNVSVTFVPSAGGGVTGGTTTTNGSGIATVGSWTLSNTEGPNTLTATATGSGISGNPVTFNATGSAGAPDADNSSLGVNTNSRIAGGAGVSVTVTVKDGIGGGNLLANVPVSFTDNGTEFATGTTNGSGVATASYSGNAAGSHTIGASAGGVTITQTQTVTVSAGAPANLAFSTQPPNSVSSGVAFTVAVSVTDGFGNTTNATVHLDLSRADATPVTLGGTNDIGSSGGVATFSDLTVSDPSISAYTLTASSTGTDSPNSTAFLVNP